eukprot:734649-Pyramimonas_sp.AAC.2
MSERGMIAEQLLNAGVDQTGSVVGKSQAQVPVTVPRRFYINLTEPDIDADCGRSSRKRVHLNPPRSRPALNLYEVELAEAEMADSAQEMANQMAAQVPNPALSAGPSHAVEGVYESHVPLQFSALLNAGCVVQ